MLSCRIHWKLDLQTPGSYSKENYRFTRCCIQRNEFFHISIFGNIPISQHTFQTPFDDNVLDDEDPDLGNFIIPDHPARPQYLPASSSGTQTTPSPNRFALLAPIPP